MDMSIRTKPTTEIEGQAMALLKMVEITVAETGCDFTRAFENMAADAMVRGHAWRAIKYVCPSPVLFARKASKAAVVAMLRKAIAFAAKARGDHPGLIEQGENADKWIVAQRLGGWQRKVDKAITKALKGY